MRAEIRLVIEKQEALGLDVLVHGEPERNDMVEYFGEQLWGFAFTEFGWVQSYGSRCVKPPIIFGDICRHEPMTVEWTRYAQSLTRKPMKGMLTGPVTILQWSFVRDDRPRAEVALQIALEEGVAVLPRGGGTSQCGQTVGHALVIDHSKHLNQVVAFDRDSRTVCVQPGMVLDRLNAWLKPHGLWYPVDVSTSAQATLGGMAGNNSCGSRSIHYGNMVHNVRAIDAVLADGSEFEFGAVPADLGELDAPRGYLELVRKIRAIAAREAEEIERRFPMTFVEYAEGVPVDVGGVRVTPHEVCHPSAAPPYALRLECGGKVLAFSGDTKWVDSLLPAARDADLFIAECFGFDEQVGHHMTWRDIERNLERLAAKRVLLTHMNAEMLANRERVRDRRVLLAADGMQIDI